MKIFLVVYLFVIISMSAEIGWIVVKGKRDSQTFSFISCQILLNVWSFSQIFLLASATDSQLFLSYCVGNTAICWIGPIFLWFSFYTKDSRKKPPTPLIFVNIIVSSVLMILSFTNNIHHLYYTEFSLKLVQHGFLFYINIAYVYACIVWGIINLFKIIIKDKSKKNQIALLIIACLVPLLSNALNLSGVIKTVYDITPLAFSVSSVLCLLATDRYGFLNVNSIAFDKALESIDEGVVVFNQKEEVTYYNEAITRYFKIDESTTKNDLYSQFNKDISDNSNDYFETDLLIDNKIIRLKKYPIFNKNNRLVAITLLVSDITKFHEMRIQEQALFEARENLTIEHERNRIAQEVHDTTGHTLTMLNALSKLTTISINNNDLTCAKQYSTESEAMSSQGISQLRMSINNLRNNLKPSMIVKGLEQLADSARGVKVEVCVQGEETNKFAFCSNTIYENTREAITNCVRYSSASQMDIIVKLLDTCAEVYIIDNGEGCDNISLGNGLKGMKERCEKIGGTVNFTSSSQCGFKIAMMFPIMKG